jgi:hypothetical protein
MIVSHYWIDPRVRHFSYERFKGLLVRRPQAEEVDGEPVTPVTAP